MAQHFDVSLKALFLDEGDGIIRKLLFGGKVVEFLSTEQPQISNRRTDVFARIEDGTLHQVEFQASNEPDFSLRMLEYYVYWLRVHGQHVTQIMLYLGRDPLRMDTVLTTPVLGFHFTVVNLRELDAAPLIESSDLADNILALLAKGEPEKALDAVLPRIRGLLAARREKAVATLTFLSGILGVEQKLESRLKEFGMIDLMENTIIGPAIRKGLAQGLEQGRQEGQREFLRELLADKFGALPVWALDRLNSASPDDLNRWGKRILHPGTIEDTLQ